ncbi:MAG: hypothetical protein IPJ82_06140 [Lewinellaceae bacterium]|nr:hypothetical protein [Lewinellaceae bacterium]
MYDSLRLFYANGGGNCYIISVGPYPSNISSLNSSALESVLKDLALEDEPTIILAPDAVSTSGGPYGFQQKALGQCQNLMDRITLCDLVHDTMISKPGCMTFATILASTTSNMERAYGPWIRTNLPRTLFSENVSKLEDHLGNPISLKTLTTDGEIIKIIDDLGITETSIGNASSAESGITGSATISFESQLKALLSQFDASTDTNAESKLNTITDFVIRIVLAVRDIDTALPSSRKPSSN